MATMGVAQATFSGTYSRIPYLFWNHMQNSRRLHVVILRFATYVSSSDTLEPDHVLSELKLWSMRHGQLLDARRALDSTYSMPLGLLLLAVLGLATTLNVRLFVKQVGIDDLQTEYAAAFPTHNIMHSYCCLRILLFQLLHCSVYLILILVMAWRNFKLEQARILVFADIVAVLAAAAAMSTSSAPRPSSPPETFFSLDPDVIERARELMLNCAFQAPSVTSDHSPQRHEYAYVAPLCTLTRESCAPWLALFDNGGAAENCTSSSLHDAYLAASAQLQRLTLMDAAKSSAHHTVFDVPIDTALLLSWMSFAVSGLASGLTLYFSIPDLKTKGS